MAGDGRADDRVIRILKEHCILRGKMAEERHMGDTGGRGNLVDGGGVIAMFDEQLHGGRLDSGPGTFGLGHPIMLVTNIMGFKPPRWVRWRAIDDNRNVRLSNLVSVEHAQAAD